jgi:hypothetical protein
VKKVNEEKGGYDCAGGAFSLEGGKDLVEGLLLFLWRKVGELLDCFGKVFGMGCFLFDDLVENRFVADF